jgi:hypothetical protein
MDQAVCDELLAPWRNPTPEKPWCRRSVRVKITDPWLAFPRPVPNWLTRQTTRRNKGGGDGKISVAKFCYGSGSAFQTRKSGRSGAKVEATTGLATTADAVNRKAYVAFGRGSDGGSSHPDRQIIGLAGQVCPLKA